MSIEEIFTKLLNDEIDQAEAEVQVKSLLEKEKKEAFEMGVLRGWNEDFIDAPSQEEIDYLYEEAN